MTQEYYFRPEMLGGITASNGHLATFPGMQLIRKDPKKSFVPAAIIKEISPKLSLHDLPSPLKIEGFPEDEYEIVSLLGAGSYSAVYKALRRSTGEYVALKIHRHGEAFLVAGILEAAITLKFQQNNCFLPLLDVFVGPNCHFTTVMPMASASLESVKKIDHNIDYMISIIKPLLQSLSLLHNAGLVHTDVKPENILFWGDRPYLIDFGSVVFASECHSRAVLQTPIYRSPEMVIMRKISPSIDIWSVGCITYELLRGIAFFNPTRDSQLLECIIKEFGPMPSVYKANGDFSYSWVQTHRLQILERELSPDSRAGAAIEFIRECMNLDFTQRLEASELLKLPLFAE